MIKLLKIDLIKLTNYRAFWVLSILYGLLIVGVPAGIIEFLKWLQRIGAEFDVDFMKIPILHFPDIWQNMTWAYTFMKIFLAIIIIISVSNEFSYKTIRQNIIDGFDRMDFLKSKMATILLMSLASTVLLFFTGLITGLIYTPDVELGEIFSGIQFVFAFFLESLTFLTMAFLLTVLLKRSALTVFMLLLLLPIEFILTGNLIPDSMEYLNNYFPVHALLNLNFFTFPFLKYALQEIQDYVAWEAVLVVIGYQILFVWAIYRKLVKSDL